MLLMNILSIMVFISSVALVELFLYMYCFHFKSWNEVYKDRDYKFKHPETNVGILLRIFWFPSWLILQLLIKIYLAIKYNF